MSDPQFVNGPIWIFECQHMTMSPDDSCPTCAEVAQAVEDERERWLKICLSMSVGSLDERIKKIEESQIVTPELLTKVVPAILEADHE